MITQIHINHIITIKLTCDILLILGLFTLFIRNYRPFYKGFPEWKITFKKFKIAYISGTIDNFCT